MRSRIEAGQVGRAAGKLGGQGKRVALARSHAVTFFRQVFAPEMCRIDTTAVTFCGTRSHRGHMLHDVTAAEARPGAALGAAVTCGHVFLSLTRTRARACMRNMISHARVRARV